MIIYNEIEPYAAQWLRNLADADQIAPGRVDERSIADLTADDVRDATQFHTFAGIGVWSYALRLAGWPDDAPVWTGSAPCQPFSTAGKRRGTDDPRHLAPKWLELISECRPPVVFGEQVASPSGRAWLDDLRTQMEALGYAVGAADLSAASIGAPHVRQRLYFGAVRLGHSIGSRPQRRLERRESANQRTTREASVDGGVGNAVGQRREGEQVRLRARLKRESLSEATRPSGHGDVAQVRVEGVDSGATGSFWARPDWLLCRDAKVRPVEPGTFPLAHGPTARVARIRAYGNAIVAPLAAEFITAFTEASA